MSKKGVKILKICLSLLLLAAICLAVFLPLKLTGVLDQFDSVDDIKTYIKDGGIVSCIIFFAIQFAQVSFIPIPAAVTTIAGSAIFGPWIAFAVSFSAIMLASLFSFFLGKVVGRKFVNWMVGEDAAKKWSKKISQGKYVFFFMMLFPFFPDDILCILVGCSKMTWRFFIITNLIARPPTLLILCFLGSGWLIPFSGWGIWVWIGVAIFAALVLVLSYIYKDKIEKFFVKLSDKLTRKKKIKTLNNNQIKQD